MSKRNSLRNIRIEHVCIRNFKTIKELDMDLAPFTILIGPNNSGKSSIFRILQATLLTENEPIRFIHTKFDLDSYRDIVHKHDIKLPIYVKLRMSSIEISDPEFEIEYEISSTDDEECFIRFFRIIDIKFGNRIELDLSDMELRISRAGNMVLESVKVRELSDICEFLCKNNVLKIISSLPLIVMHLMSSNMFKEHRKVVKVPLFLCSEILNMLLTLRYDLEVYSLLACSERSIHRRFIRPEDQSLSLLINSLKNNDVRARVSTWLKKIVSLDDIKIMKIEPSLYAITVRNRDLEFNIADLGNGIAYLLPMLTACAICRSIIIIEEPELHLHPCAQAELVDIFVDLVRSGKQVIIETHSEHIIARLCRLVSENKLPSNLVKIYYVYLDSNLETKLKELKISSAGVLLEMPDFYEHDIEELIQTLRARGEIKLSDIEELYNIYKARYIAGEHDLSGLVELLEVLVKIGKIRGTATFKEIKQYILTREPELEDVLESLERLLKAYKFKKAKVEVREEDISKIVTGLRSIIEKLKNL